MIEWAEEHFCTCGAGHGSYEGHVDWCVWLKVEPVYTALIDANEVCRSTMSIVDRKGQETNWSGFKKQLAKALEQQHKLMYPERYAPSVQHHEEGK